MTDFSVRFEIDAEAADGADLERRLRAHLGALPAVSDLATRESRSRSVTGVIAFLAAGALIAKEGTSAATALADLVKALKQLMVEIHGLRDAYLELNGKKLKVSEISDADIKAAAGGDAS